MTHDEPIAPGQSADLELDWSDRAATRVAVTFYFELANGGANSDDVRVQFSTSDFVGDRKNFGPEFRGWEFPKGERFRRYMIDVPATARPTKLVARVTHEGSRNNIDRVVILIDETPPVQPLADQLRQATREELASAFEAAGGDARHRSRDVLG